MSSNHDRQLSKVIGTFEMWDGRRAREVVATYGEGHTRREIEIAVDETYSPRYWKIRDD